MQECLWVFCDKVFSVWLNLLFINDLIFIAVLPEFAESLVLYLQNLDKLFIVNSSF